MKRLMPVLLCLLLITACGQMQVTTDTSKLLNTMGARGAGVGLGLALGDVERIDMALSYLNTTIPMAKDAAQIKSIIDFGMAWVRQEVEDPLLLASINDLYTSLNFKVVEEGEAKKLTFNLEFLKANLPTFIEGLVLSKAYLKE